MEDSTPGPRAAPAPQPTAADMVEIYYAPSAVFERRRSGKFGLPLVVFLVAMTVLFYATANLMRPVMDADWRTASEAMLRKNPAMTPEMLESARGMTQKFAIVGIFFMAIIGPLLAGFLLWIAGKVVGVRQALAVAITVAVFAFYPMLVEMIVNAIQAAVVPEASITSRYSLSLGPARFLGPDAGPALKAFLGHIDVFTLWMAALIAIGVKVTARATTAQAVTVAGIMWLLGALPALLGAMR